MQPLPHPDSHHLRAATGWLELGNHVEARAELEQIAAPFRAHPLVLEVRWQISAKAEKWEEAFDTATALITLLPESPECWIQKAYALRRARDGGLEQARLTLLLALAKFPEEPIIQYNLACYACQLGQFEDARSYLAKAFETGDRKALIGLALKDKDLEPIWKSLGDGGA